MSEEKFGQSITQHRLPRLIPNLFVFVAGIFILYFVDRRFLADYFARTSLNDPSLVPWINLFLTLLFEAVSLVFVLRIVSVVTGTAPRKSDLKWYQFSLRSLFVLMLMTGLAMSYARYWMDSNRTRRIKEAAKIIDSLIVADALRANPGWKFDENQIEYIGGLANLKVLVIEGPNVNDETLNCCRNLGNLVELNLFQSHITDKGLEEIAHLKKLKTLVLGNTRITDAGLDYLKDLRNLESLDLSSTLVTDAGLKNLRNFSGLKRLDLSHVEISDRGLHEISDLNCIESLSLGSSKISDNGLKELPRMDNLQSLMLSAPTITDAGLTHLQGMTKLSRVMLHGTSVTKAGVEKLKKDLPDAYIKKDLPDADITD